MGEKKFEFVVITGNQRHAQKELNALLEKYANVNVEGQCPSGAHVSYTLKCYF